MEAADAGAVTRKPALRRLVALIGGPLLGVNVIALAVLAAIGTLKLLEQQPPGVETDSLAAWIVVAPFAALGLLTWWLAWNWLNEWAREPGA